MSDSSISSGGLSLSYTACLTCGRGVEECRCELDRLLPDGYMVIERYRVLGHLATGAQAQVYRVHDQERDMASVLKVVHTSLRTMPQSEARRFLNEVHLPQRVRHENVVIPYDMGVIWGRPYLVTHLVVGQPLADRLSQKGRMGLNDILRVLRVLGEAVQAVHDQGIVHRDLKCENVLIDLGGRPHLVDFGIARLLESERLTNPGMAVGSPTTIAPEAIDERRPVDHRADVYSLGVILFQMLTGVPPFRSRRIMELLQSHVSTPAPRPSDLCPDLPPEIDRVALRCLEKDPDRRFDRADAIAEALSHAIESRVTGKTQTVKLTGRLAELSAAYREGLRTPLGPSEDESVVPNLALPRDGK